MNSDIRLTMLDILEGHAVTVNIHTGSYSLYKMNYGFQKNVGPCLD